MGSQPDMQIVTMSHDIQVVSHSFLDPNDVTLRNQTSNIVKITFFQNTRLFFCYVSNIITISTFFLPFLD